jgi:hypothetical protein
MIYMENPTKQLLSAGIDFYIKDRTAKRKFIKFIENHCNNLVLCNALIF